jgi:hypothetical protein
MMSAISSCTVNCSTFALAINAKRTSSGKSTNNERIFGGLGFFGAG